MKKTLLLLFACLFGALSGVKAYNFATPEAGKAYYLWNTEFSQFWYASSVPLGDNRYYGVTSDISAATPIYVETAGNEYDYTFSFYLGGDKWFMNQNNGNTYLWGDGSCKFRVWADGDGKYYLRTQEHKQGTTTYRYYLNAESASGTCNFQNSKDHYCEWQFVPAEEVMTTSLGWEKVTTKEQLATNTGNYLYSIFSATKTGVMLEAYPSGTYANKLCYKSMQSPLNNVNNLFEMRGYAGEFALKSCSVNKYMANSGSYPWDYDATKSSVDDDCLLTVTCEGGVFKFQDKHSDGNAANDVNVGNYLGAWDNVADVLGERLAGNKGVGRAGSFIIYRIPKYNLDMTGCIFNHSFESDNVSDSKRAGAKGWTLPQTDGDTKVQLNSNETYTMTLADGNQLFNTWNGDATGYTISQTISNLPAGQYKVSAVMASFENKTLQLKANDATGTAPSVNKGTGVEVNTYVTLENPGDIAISAKTADDAFYKVDNFRLTYYGTPATSADYTALQNAINDAEAKTLGFDYEEYAPYNNVAALNALAEAKAIDQSANNQQMLVQEATNALTSKSWTANSGNVDAVFNGLFSSSEDWGLTGWTRTNAWGQQQTGLEGDYATAYYNHPGSLVYGSTGCYSMPLNVSQVYKLTFAYRSHESGSNNSVTASINKKGGSAVFSKQYGDNPSTTEWRVVTAFFTTQAPGDYVLTLANSGNTWITGVSIEKLPSTVPATIGENGYTTFASTYPLDLTQANLPVGVKAYKATSINSSYVHFEKLDQVVPANTGVLLEGTHGVHDIRVGSEVAEVTDNLFLVNESNGVFPAEENTTYYAMVKKSNPMTFGKFDPSVVAVPNYKAYLAVTGGSARLTVMFDGEDPTAINAIEAAEAEDGALKDGKYLIDGKIVIVKNGVKYSANGQKLN